MNLTTARARFDQYVLNEDTADPLLVTVGATNIKDWLINEAYLEYHAKLGGDFLNSSDIVTGLAAGTFTSDVGLAIDLESFELKVGSIYRPLSRSNVATLRWLQQTEGQVGSPDRYGVELVSRNQVTNSTVLLFAVYPVPAAVTAYRPRMRRFATELAAGVDGLQMDEDSADLVCMLAAWRAGMIAGYSDQWAASLLARVPDTARTMFEIESRTTAVAPPGGL